MSTVTFCERSAVITTELVSVGRAALTDLLEQWWATVDVRGEDGGSCRVRLSIEWSPWDKKFTVDPDAITYLRRDTSSGPVPGRAEIVGAFRGSDAEARAHQLIHRQAQRYRTELPDRAQAMRDTR